MLHKTISNNVFLPDDVQVLSSALRLASDRLGRQYGLTGSKLKSAEQIAADAICKVAGTGELDRVRLAKEGVESVRIFMTRTGTSSRPTPRTRLRIVGNQHGDQ